MKARITKTYRAAPTGQPMPRDYHPGTEVEGELAEWAVADGCAVEIKATAPRENKAGGRVGALKSPALDSGPDLDDAPAQKG